MRFLYVLIIVAFLDTFIQLPIISPFAQELGASSFLTGMIIAIYSLTNMVGNTITGHWIDRYGRKKILVISMTLVALIVLLYPLVETAWALFFVRFIHGLAGGALIPAAFAYLGDMTSSKHRGKSMAYTGACIGTTAIIGPALGGIISSSLSIAFVYYFVSICFLLTMVLTLFLTKESFVPSDRNNVSIADFKKLLENPIMIQASIGAFALMGSMGILTYALPLKLEELSYNSAITGVLLSSFGIVALIIFLTPLNQIFDVRKPETLIMMGLTLVFMSLFILSQVDSIVFITLLMIFYGVGFAFVFPSMNRMIVEISSIHDRGKAFGIFYAAFSFGVVFGSMSTGVIAEIFQQPFIFGGIFVLLLAITFTYLVKRHQASVKMN